MAAQNVTGRVKEIGKRRGQIRDKERMDGGPREGKGRIPGTVPGAVRFWVLVLNCDMNINSRSYLLFLSLGERGLYSLPIELCVAE